MPFRLAQMPFSVLPPADIFPVCLFVCLCVCLFSVIIIIYILCFIREEKYFILTDFKSAALRSQLNFLFH